MGEALIGASDGALQRRVTISTASARPGRKPWRRADRAALPGG